MEALNSLSPMGRDFLARTPWDGAAGAPIAGDASARKYYRLLKENRSAVLMDASQVRECVTPFYQLATHLQRLGFSAPTIYAWDVETGFMLVEDFGDDTFTRLLEQQFDQEQLYVLATEVLIALHKNAAAVPPGWREYHAEKMLADIELFLEWRTPGIVGEGQAEFRAAWRAALPLAFHVPESLLLRDYHVANLMLLRDRAGYRQAGLLDFQDAYRGPVTYDLVSLLEDARRDVPVALQEKMTARYLEQFPALVADAFAASMAVLAALRHTRVLAIFERLSARDHKHDYKKLHSPRVERMLQKALSNPALARVKRWFEQYAS